jgi:hypothetical protein
LITLLAASSKFFSAQGKCKTWQEFMLFQVFTLKFTSTLIIEAMAAWLVLAIFAVTQF